MNKLVKAIRTLERACLIKGHKPTTEKSVLRNGKGETRSYFKWLCQQAPMTSTYIIDSFEKLTDGMEW